MKKKIYSLGNGLKAAFFPLNISSWTEKPPKDKDFSGKPRADAGGKYLEQQSQMLGPLAGHGNLTMLVIKIMHKICLDHRTIF